MTVEERNRIFDILIAKAREMFIQKGNAYSGIDNDSLSNFKSTAKRIGLSPFEVLYVFMDKHYLSISNAIRNMEGDIPVEKTENLEGRIIDLINYLVLLYCLKEDLSNERK